MTAERLGAAAVLPEFQFARIGVTAPLEGPQHAALYVGALGRSGERIVGHGRAVDALVILSIAFDTTP